MKDFLGTYRRKRLTDESQRPIQPDLWQFEVVAYISLYSWFYLLIRCFRDSLNLFVPFGFNENGLLGVSIIMISIWIP